MHHDMHDHTKCIQDCNDCRDECEKTFFQHCLTMGGKHIEEKHAKLMADCIEICQTTANFMLRGSEQHAATCAICADICEACADSCEEIGGKEMEQCAEMCRRCAQSCREMSAAHGLSGSDKGKYASANVM